MKIDKLSNLKHLPEVSLLVSAQCNKLVRNMVNLKEENNGFLKVELLAATNDIVIRKLQEH